MQVSRQILIMAALGTPLARAQAGSNYPSPYVPRYTVALGYEHIRANAPPAVCNCFNTNGGFVAASYAFSYWLHGVAEVTGNRDSNIGPLGQNLTLLTYTAGPQVVLHVHRVEPYVQALFGAAHASDSYFPTSTSYSTSANSFAYQGGGGIDFTLSRRIGVKLIEAQYLHTGFPNGTNNAQNHLMLGAGIVFRMHGSLWTPDPGRQRARAYKSMRRQDRSPAPSATSATNTTPSSPASGTQQEAAEITR